MPYDQDLALERSAVAFERMLCGRMGFPPTRSWRSVVIFSPVICRVLASWTV